MFLGIIFLSYLVAALKVTVYKILTGLYIM